MLNHCWWCRSITMCSRLVHLHMQSSGFHLHCCLHTLNDSHRSLSNARPGKHFLVQIVWSTSGPDKHRCTSTTEEHAGLSAREIIFGRLMDGLRRNWFRCVSNPCSLALTLSLSLSLSFLDKRGPLNFGEHTVCVTHSFPGPFTMTH